MTVTIYQSPLLVTTSQMAFLHDVGAAPSTECRKYPYLSDRLPVYVYIQPQPQRRGWVGNVERVGNVEKRQES